jgi:hypothetical protein
MLALDQGVSGPEEHARLIATQKAESEGSPNWSEQR